ncbi:MAG: ABC transporter permease [Rothia sp. (in: high G+C Gram-positive bacteria)]|uniref:ABC transporter permease n=1 Tax=Rothia sp. (in: high G+C Gram-positive bacteria) TaxID=1885016 RepID=UPI00271036C1|nr:ABC transporter permease [Rothia sp. (in: high G+C Gram-positive bacteria)]
MSEHKPATPQVDPALAADTAVKTPPQDVPSQLVATEKPSTFARIAGGNIGLSIGAALAAFIVGGLLIAATDPATQKAAGYFFARPLDTISAGWTAAYESYLALLQGAIYNPNGKTFIQQIRPITETLTVATPLIFAGLAVALSFRAGLFNIGAQGQIILGAIVSGWVGLNAGLPAVVTIPLVILGGIIGGALWGGIIGVLKAKTGAHEVILSIMMNYIAANLLVYLLKTPLLQREGSSNPISEKLPEAAAFPQILGPSFRLHLGFILAILAVLFISWLLNRSTIGFRLRAVGANPNAARTAGISVASGYIIVMAISGALAGLAGTAQVSGTEKVLTTGIAGTLGFDAITVALLGRSTPWGTFFAALLFGAFRAGGVSMQVATGTSIDIVLVLQALIVLFIAAPPLVRAMFRLPDPTGKPKKKKSAKKKAVEA